MATDQDFKGFYEENKALLKDYIDTRLKLLKLQGISVLSRSFGFVIALCMVSCMVLFTLLFLGMSFAWWLTDITHSAALGFGGAAGLFFIISLIFVVFRKPLFLNPMIRLFIRETSRDLHQNED